MAVLGAAGLGAVLGWLLTMVWMAGPRHSSGGIVVVVLGSFASAGLALGYSGNAGLLALAVSAVVFAGLHVGWRRWLTFLTTRSHR